MLNYIQRGDTANVLFPENGISGVPMLIGPGVFGVPQGHTVKGDVGPLVTVGVFRLPKKPGEAIPAGAKLYWDEANGYMTATVTDAWVASAPIGADPGAATVDARLNGIPI